MVQGLKIGVHKSTLEKAFAINKNNNNNNNNNNKTIHFLTNTVKINQDESEHSYQLTNITIVFTVPKFLSIKSMVACKISLKIYLQINLFMERQEVMLNILH